MAIPAKRGLWKTVKLADGTEVSVQLRGDEHYHFWQDAEGQRYEKAGDCYRLVSADEASQKAAAKAAARRARAKAMPRRTKIGGDHPEYKGSKKALLLLVEFSDVSFSTDNSLDFYKEVANKRNFASTKGHVGSVRDYFYDQSNGQFDFTCDVVGPVKLDKSYSYYGQNFDYRGRQNDDGEDDIERIVEMVKSACQKVNDQVNFADYDWDGDGEAELIFLLYAGVGENDSYSAGPETIWPHMYQLDWANSAFTLDKTKVNTYACAAELTTQVDDNGTQFIGTAGIGTMCHEFSHCFGLPDMYATDDSDNYGMCTWSILDQGSYNGLAYMGFIPAGYTAYELMYLGWKQPIELTEDTEVKNMKPLSQNGDTYIIYNDANRNEYFLLENRQMTGTWDQALDGDGLLITHVDYDANIWENNAVNSTSGYYYPNDHQRCTVVAADNSYETYKTTYYGGYEIQYWDRTDVDGDCFPYTDPQTGAVKNNTFSNTSIPRANLYNKNTDGTKLLNKALTDITQNADGTISFKFVSNVGGGGSEQDPELFFKETFDQCKGNGGNDGKWGGNVSYAALTPDNAGWASATARGASQCAKAGNASVSQPLTSPTFSLRGNAEITFKAAACQGDATDLRVELIDEEDQVVKTQNFTMKQAEWTSFTMSVNYTGKVRLKFWPKQRFFLDDVMAATPGTTGIRELTPASAAVRKGIFTLDGRYVGQSLQGLPHGIYVKDGRKVVR